MARKAAQLSSTDVQQARKQLVRITKDRISCYTGIKIYRFKASENIDITLESETNGKSIYKRKNTTEDQRYTKY